MANQSDNPDKNKVDLKKLIENEPARNEMAEQIDFYSDFAELLQKACKYFIETDTNNKNLVETILTVLTKDKWSYSFDDLIKYNRQIYNLKNSLSNNTPEPIFTFIEIIIKHINGIGQDKFSAELPDLSYREPPQDSTQDTKSKSKPKVIDQMRQMVRKARNEPKGKAWNWKERFKKEFKKGTLHTYLGKITNVDYDGDLDRMKKGGMIWYKNDEYNESGRTKN